MDFIPELKRRIFGLDNLASMLEPAVQEYPSPEFTRKDIDTGRFRLEEVLEWLSRGENTPVIRNDVIPDVSLKELDQNIFAFTDELEKPKRLLLEISEGLYYLYARRENKQREQPAKASMEEENGPELYVPTGVVIRTVSQGVLGTGVLGRAFIHSGYIEILDSLVGRDYMEVLTHELLHLQFPEYGEMKIRAMTRNYVGNTTYN